MTKETIENSVNDVKLKEESSGFHTGWARNLAEMYEKNGLTVTEELLIIRQDYEQAIGEKDKDCVKLHCYNRKDDFYVLVEDDYNTHNCRTWGFSEDFMAAQAIAFIKDFNVKNNIQKIRTGTNELWMGGDLIKRMNDAERNGNEDFHKDEKYISSSEIDPYMLYRVETQPGHELLNGVYEIPLSKRIIRDYMESNKSPPHRKEFFYQMYVNCKLGDYYGIEAVQALDLQIRQGKLRVPDQSIIYAPKNKETFNFLTQYDAMLEREDQERNVRNNDNEKSTGRKR
jgi:hypothetical protein